MCYLNAVICQCQNFKIAFEGQGVIIRIECRGLIIKLTKNSVNGSIEITQSDLPSNFLNYTNDIFVLEIYNSAGVLQTITRNTIVYQGLNVTIKKYHVSVVETI